MISFTPQLPAEFSPGVRHEDPHRTTASAIPCAALACLAIIAGLAHAQPVPGKPVSFPLKPVRILVGNAPGGANDFIARLVGQKLHEAWAQPVIIDNRSGGSGVIAMELAARAVADGHTLLVSNSQMSANMLLGKVPFDIRKVYIHVVQLTTQMYVVAVNISLPVNSVKELIAYSKSKVNAISYGTPGTGSPAHLGIEQFKLMTGASMLHVPYKGNGPAMIDLISGQIQLVFGSSVSVMPQARGGKLRALAVTGPRRAPLLPDLPTVAEAGTPGYALTNAYGFFVPAGTPAAIVDMINQQSNAVIAAREFKARLEADGVEAAAPNTPSDYRGAVQRDITELEKFFKTPGIVPETFK